MPIGVCCPLFISSYCFEKVMKWKWCGQINNPSWRLQALCKAGIMIKNLVLSSSLTEGMMGSQEKHNSMGSVKIQKEAAKLLKLTTIMPYRAMSGPIIKEIDDD